MYALVHPDHIQVDGELLDFFGRHGYRIAYTLTEEEALQPGAIRDVYGIVLIEPTVWVMLELLQRHPGKIVRIASLPELDPDESVPYIRIYSVPCRPVTHASLPLDP